MENSLAEFEIGSGAQRGARLTLYADRLVSQANDAMETVPLAQLAAVRVAFERDTVRLGWAVALLVAALVFALVSAPLQDWLGDVAAKIGEQSRRESLEAVLLSVLTVLRGVAMLLPMAAVALAAGAVMLLVFYWLGATELTLCFAATERSYAVRGRNRFLIEFAQMVAEQLAGRGS